MKTLKVDTVLFDLDGTLLNSNALIIDSFKYVFESEFPNRVITKEEYLSFIGPSLWASFSKYEQDKEKVDAFVLKYKEHNESIHDAVKSFDGAEWLLKRLKELNYKIGIVSSKMHEMVLRGLRVNDLDKYVDVVVGYDDVKKHKPNKEPLQKAMTLLNGRKAVYIGDHPDDIRAGKNADMITCGVSYSWHYEKLKLEEPDFIVENLKEILEVIKNV